MLEPKEKQIIRFNPLPSETLKLGNTLYPDSYPSIVTLPLSHIKTLIKKTRKQWLHKEELTKLDTFSYEKRYKEWLGGRICSKQSLHNFLDQQNSPNIAFVHRQFRVASEESGRPFFTCSEGNTLSLPELSISHSKDFATALVSKTYCGIDIQHPAENLFRVKERFISDNEELLLRTLLPQLSELQHLTLLWAGKEAVKKMLSPEGIPGFLELTLLKISPKTSSTTILTFSKTGKAPLPVVAGILDTGYGIAYCCENNQSSTSL